MLTSIPGFDMSKSVTTNLKELDLDMIPNGGAGTSNIGKENCFSLGGFSHLSIFLDKEEASVGNGLEANDRHVANPSGTLSSNNKKRVYADLVLQQGEDNMGVGRTTRSRARAQQQQQQQQQQQSEESFEVPGLTNTRRGGPPNKMARRR